MVEETNDWFSVNVAEGKWFENAQFGKVCSFEQGERFSQTGVNLYVLEPDKAACRYHRERAQEDFLVLSGECRLIVNDEERRLRAWDFVHCGPGVNHVFVGAGDGPCAILMIGHRPENKELCYPVNARAEPFGASVSDETPDPSEAYAGTGEWKPCELPPWPISD
jgi:uncharacterized cupin superfamily protein